MPHVLIVADGRFIRQASVETILDWHGTCSH